MLIDAGPLLAGLDARDRASNDAKARREALNAMRWYGEWLAEQGASVHMLMPSDMKEDEAALTAAIEPARPVWIPQDGRIPLPTWERNERVWVVNGGKLPMITAEAVSDALRREACDVLVFDPSNAAGGRYVEAAAVDSDGRLLRIERHYDDSPSFTDFWSGDVSLAVTRAENAAALATHIVRRGWSLDSIGALTRRLVVRWSHAPSAHTGLETSSVVTGPLVVSEGNAVARAGRAAGDRGPARQASAVMPPASNRREARSTPASAASDANTARAMPNVADHAASHRATVRKPWFGDDAYQMVKRLFDATAALTGLIVLSPLMLVAAALVKWTSPGPALFGHRRQGLGGREFLCWKFRSMRKDADKLQDQLRAKNEVDGPQFKMADDPRVTTIGAWLRRTNIDELPQLFNVLFGQMSLVGPRPSPDKENQLCPAWRRTRLSVKPGITGLWQVLRRRNRPDSDFQEWIYYDVEYARHRSFLLDIEILLWTPVSILAPRHVDRFAAWLERRGVCTHSDRLIAMERADRERISTESGNQTGANRAPAGQDDSAPERELA